jgi:hypothetical protein
MIVTLPQGGAPAARPASAIIATKTMLERVAETPGIKPAVLAADAGYGAGPFLAGLQARAVMAPIPVRITRG